MRMTMCDRCGHCEHEYGGISGKEFEYIGKWYTLTGAFQFTHPDLGTKVVDVCAGCYKEITNAVNDAQKEAAKVSEREYHRRIIGASMPPQPPSPSPRTWWQRLEAFVGLR